MSTDLLQRIQTWYLAQCNGDWEHSYGVKLETLDNPGWLLHIDLRETELESRIFTPINIQRNEENDWFQCRIESNQFYAACGPLNLSEILSCFLDWAEHAP